MIKSPKTNKLSNEFNRVIKVVLNSNAIMQLNSSELKNFFSKKLKYEVCKISYDNNTSFKEVKSIINKKIKGKTKVLAIMKGNKKTTLDHLSFIWEGILKHTQSVSWGYYQSNKPNNSLYLLTY